MLLSNIIKIKCVLVKIVLLSIIQSEQADVRTDIFYERFKNELDKAYKIEKRLIKLKNDVAKDFEERIKVEKKQSASKCSDELISFQSDFNTMLQDRNKCVNKAINATIQKYEKRIFPIGNKDLSNFVENVCKCITQMNNFNDSVAIIMCLLHVRFRVAPNLLQNVTTELRELKVIVNICTEIKKYFEEIYTNTQNKLKSKMCLKNIQKLMAEDFITFDN